VELRLDVIAKLKSNAELKNISVIGYHSGVI